METFKMMLHWVTLTKDQGHSLYLKVEKYFLGPFWTISQALFIESIVIKLGQKVACGKSFKMMWHWVTLTFRQGHSIYWKFGKYQFLTISDTIHSRIMRPGQKVSCVETFKMVWHLVTLSKGQGHNLYLKVKKYPFLTILDNLSDTIYWKYRYEIWPKDSLWKELRKELTLHDRDWRSRS